MIKAIDTEYAGHLFRSRLEARHAIYFDALGISWEYESEGYEFENGVRYLPDFYFPTFNMFAEVKPTPLTTKEKWKCEKLALETGKVVIELVGLPNAEWKNIIVPDNNKVFETEGFLLFESDNPSYMPIYYGRVHDCYTKNNKISKAVNKAKRARFEFNKKDDLY